MSSNTAGAVSFCPGGQAANENRTQRRKQRPKNSAAERRKTLRARGSLKSYPSHWSPAQVKKRMDLRKWEDSPKIKSRDAYSVKHLLLQKSECRLKPYVLAEFSALDPRMGFMLGCVVLACLVRGAKAVSGTRVEWGSLVSVGGTQAFEFLKHLVGTAWLERLPQFVPHVSTGRDGEHLDHRQLPNMYRPGIRLKAAWQALQSELANASRRRAHSPRSSADGRRLPSLRSKSIQASVPNTALGPLPSTADSKVPPSAGPIVSPPLAAPGYHRPPAGTITAPPPNEQAARGVPLVAAFGGEYKSATRADNALPRSASPGARPPTPRPIPDDDKALLDDAHLDKAHQRTLWRTYLADTGDGESRGLACSLARATLALMCQNNRRLSD